MANETIKVNDRNYAWPRVPVVGVCLDGSQPAHDDEPGYIEEAVRAGVAPYFEPVMRQHGFTEEYERVRDAFHAGDPMWMRRTVQLAENNGVAVGAHPSFPDLNGFGRRTMKVSPEEATNDLVYQIGALQAFDRPSRSSVFPRLVERKHIVNAVAMESIVWNGVRILGPVLAGFVIERVSIEASMFISAATFYLMGAIISVLRMRPRPPATGQVLRQVGDSIRYIRQNPIFFYVMLLTFCNSLFGMAYIGLMPEFAEEVLGVGAGKIGLLLGALGIGAILGNWVIGNLKHGFPKGKLILAGAFLYGLFQILFAVAASQQQYGVSMGILFLVGVSNSLYWVGGLSTLQELVPDQLRGRVMGLYGATWSLGSLGMAQGAFVADHINAPWAVGIGAGILAAVAVLVFAFSPEIRTLRSGDTGQLRPAYTAQVVTHDQ